VVKKSKHVMSEKKSKKSVNFEENQSERKPKKSVRFEENQSALISTIKQPATPTFSKFGARDPTPSGNTTIEY